MKMPCLMAQDISDSLDSCTTREMFIRKKSGSNTAIATFKLKKKKSNNANAKPRNCVCYQVILSMRKISVLQIQTLSGMVGQGRREIL